MIWKITKRMAAFGLMLMLAFGSIFGLMPLEKAQAEAFHIKAFRNLDYTFQTTDGSFISTEVVPSKDVTLLIFGRTTCASTWLTIRNIAESSWIHDSKVSVIYVDIDGADTEVINGYIEQYSRLSEDSSQYFNGCEKMVFCHDAEGKNEEARKMYHIMSNIWEKVNLPMIMMIDKNDIVREMLTGYCSADEILSVIKQVIVCGEDVEADDKKDNTEKDNNGNNDTKKDETEQKTITVMPQNVHLSKTNVVWNGKAQKPSITVKDAQGNKISKTNYTIRYRNNKNVGQATATIVFKNKYNGKIQKVFTINPKGTNIVKFLPKKKGFIVKWKKQASQTSGYEIQYAENAKFKRAKMVKNLKPNATSKSIVRLKAKKNYYVRIRTYKNAKINGKNTKLCSSWSNTKKVTTKK